MTPLSTEGPDRGPSDSNGTWVLLNDEVRQRLDVQREALAHIEARAAIVLGAAFAALQFVAEKPLSSPWLPLAASAYVGAMACSLIAVLPGSFQEIEPNAVVLGLWFYQPDLAAAELANNRLFAFNLNEARRRRIVFLVRVAVVLAVLGAILSTLHLTEEIAPMWRKRRPSQPSAPVVPPVPEAAAPPPQPSAPVVPPVPQAAAPPPNSPPRPGVRTMDLTDGTAWAPYRPSQGDHY